MIYIVIPTLIRSFFEMAICSIRIKINRMEREDGI